MGKITNKHIIKIKELISESVCMGTFGLVELELMEMEKALLSDTKNTIHNTEYTKCPSCGGEMEGSLTCTTCGDGVDIR